jgi:hypothetical protein
VNQTTREIYPMTVGEHPRTPACFATKQTRSLLDTRERPYRTHPHVFHPQAKITSFPSLILLWPLPSVDVVSSCGRYTHSRRPKTCRPTTFGSKRKKTFGSSRRASNGDTHRLFRLVLCRVANHLSVLLCRAQDKKDSRRRRGKYAAMRKFWTPS